MIPRPPRNTFHGISSRTYTRCLQTQESPPPTVRSRICSAQRTEAPPPSLTKDDQELVASGTATPPILREQSPLSVRSATKSRRTQSCQKKCQCTLENRPQSKPSNEVQYEIISLSTGISA